jgi:CBS domain containing-hemolysin-like protein
VRKILELKLPEEAGYTTLAGFLLAQAGRRLKAVEGIEYEGTRFTVERLERGRIRRIRFTPAHKPEAQSLAALIVPLLRTGMALLAQV